MRKGNTSSFTRHLLVERNADFQWRRKMEIDFHFTTCARSRLTIASSGIFRWPQYFLINEKKKMFTSRCWKKSRFCRGHVQFHNLLEERNKFTEPMCVLLIYHSTLFCDRFGVSIEIYLAHSQRLKGFGMWNDNARLAWLVSCIFSLFLRQWKTSLTIFEIAKTSTLVLGLVDTPCAL